MTQNDPIKILVVDDDAKEAEFISEGLAGHNYSIDIAIHGRDACHKMRESGNDYYAILLDREMPVMDGLEFIEWLKENNFEKTPVVMITKDDNPQMVKEGIDAGVFYYLNKPIQHELLKSVVASAVTSMTRRKNLQREIKEHGISMHLIDKCMFTVKTLEDAESVSCFIASLFPCAETALQGLAEIIINAVEHGNLGITYEEKTQFILDRTWRKEIEKRQQMPEYIDKKVTIYYHNAEDSYRVTILDEGKGFDWKQYISMNPSRATDNHGRGIAKAKLTSFDEIIYNDVGNKVTVILYKENIKQDDLQWK
ncbi:response regulator [Rickettsiales bacterium]|nr:response regulator [Rickettsiales bacterium]